MAEKTRKRAAKKTSGPEPSATVADGLMPTGYTCASCGGGVGLAPITEAVTVTYANSDGQVGQFYLCLRKDKTHKRCAAKVLGSKTVTAKYAATGTDGLAFYDPADMT